MSSLFHGQSLARILMNESLREETLRGCVVDVGGGRDPNYFNFLQHSEKIQIEIVDASISGIDFERDPLPFADGHVDTVLLCNVLEHIYAHQFLMREVRRILKEEGRLVGFVPFWVGYHPDPHDYFRYTKEALKRLLEETGFREIKIVSIGGGPILANFNTIVLSLPRILRPVAYLCYAVLDAFFLTLRPESRIRNPLGYKFTAYV